jgi:hypothetical protein
MVRVGVALLLVLFPSIAWAQGEKRIALLVGNQSYTSEIGALANPHNDVGLLERSLKGLGFEVVVEKDAGLSVLSQAINAYTRRVRSAGPNAVGFFYYSGHGASGDGDTNYLIPVDVKSAEDGQLWDQSLRLTEVTRKLKEQAGNATHFVVFDACRNVLKLRVPGARALVQSKGFVPVRQEAGMLIAYATAQGELASDVGVGAGPYAKILAEEIVRPGVEAVSMFRRVQVRVRTAILQEPWLGFDALGEIYFAGAIAEPSVKAEGEFAFEETTNAGFARRLDIPVFFALPAASRAQISKVTYEPGRLIDFKHPEGRGAGGDVGLRLVVAKRPDLSARLGKSGLIQTGDILLTFRSEWGGAGPYPNMQMGISHAGLAYVKDGKARNIDNPLSDEYIGPPDRRGELNSEHYRTLNLFHGNLEEYVNLRVLGSV